MKPTLETYYKWLELVKDEQVTNGRSLPTSPLHRDTVLLNFLQGKYNLEVNPSGDIRVAIEQLMEKDKDGNNNLRDTLFG